MKKSIILIVLLFPVLIGYGQVNISKVDVGDKAYDFIGIDESGKEIKLSDYYDKKYILLNFTATFCGSCWGTYNQMNKVQEIFDKDLKVISFHWDNEKEKWYEIANRGNINFKCTSIWEAENKDEICKIYQIDGWPYFFLINKKGMIVEKWFGNNEKKLNRKIKKHL